VVQILAATNVFLLSIASRPATEWILGALTMGIEADCSSLFQADILFLSWSTMTEVHQAFLLPFSHC
jgi:hypothetical protein